jgi:cell division protein FtsI/penicillin-binding protein 2
VRTVAINVTLCLLLGASCGTASARATGPTYLQRALGDALRGTQASAVVLDARTGSVIARVGPDREGAPGSVLKPLLLAYALEHGIVRAETTVYCRRNLRVGAQALPCTHPADQVVFTASTALAESCNTWFAEMGRRLNGAQLEAALQGTRLPHRSMVDADVEERQLAVMGLRGVTASPLLLAEAYRRLLGRMPAAVAEGLRDSVRYGMADPAAVQGVEILGKTGTASDPGEAWTHGWFAGAVPGRFVVVVYVPHGDGGTAARIAGRFFAATLALPAARGSR